MQNLIINEELKSLLPPLSAEEYAGLEESILKDGCLSPLVVWNDILVDGHHRYEICTKHEIPYFVRSIEFDDINDAKLWAWKHQENRRNLTPFHRAEMALKLKYAIAAQAKKRQCMGGGRGRQPLEGGHIDTRDELAQIAGVSSCNIGKVEYITKHADEETKAKLRRGEKGTSIHKEYQRLKVREKTASAFATETARRYQEPHIVLDDAYGVIRIRKGTPPEEFAAWLTGNFSAEYLRHFTKILIGEIRSRYGNNFMD